MAEDFTQRATCECYYKFENAGDLGEDNQNQIDLTNNNNVTQSADIPSGTYASPSATKSANFEAGSSQSLSAAHNDAQEIDNISALTVVGQFKLESDPGTDFTAWSFAYPGLTGKEGHRGRIKTGTNELDFGFDGVYKAESKTWSTATWYFLAWAYDDTTDEMNVYAGAEETELAELGSGTAAADLTAGCELDFYLARKADSADRFYDGLMCELAFFTEKLTLTEIREIQADGMEGTPAPSGNPYYAIMSQFKLDWDRIFPRPQLGKLWKPYPGLIGVRNA